MIYLKKFKKFCVVETASIKNCLEQLNVYKLRTLLCVNHLGHLKGTFSFGDFNKWILEEDSSNLDLPISKVMNSKPYKLAEKEVAKLDELSLCGYNLVPVVDTNNRVIGIYMSKGSEPSLEIGAYKVNKYEKPFIIAEIGNNHNGSLVEAKKLINLAFEAGAHCAKFQLRDMSSLYGDIDDDVGENLGAQYTLDLLKRFQLTSDELLEAMAYAKEKGLVPLCTPWDEKSVDVLEDFGVEAYKVASADLTNHGFLRYLAKTGKPLICSTGMASEQEIRDSVEVLKSCGAQYVLLHCNSTYPAPFKDINLSYLPKLQEIGDCTVGYSGHERDINVAIASVALGARVIEKHFTTDRSQEGNDHKVSLLPKEFRKMVDGIDQVFAALGSNKPRKVTQGEMMNRVTLAKSIYAARDLEKGSLLESSDLVIKSPGRGLQPNYIDELLARPLKRSLRKGDVFYADDIANGMVEPRSDYSFWSKWGIPVRHHDYRELFERVRPPMLEFHLSYRDLDLCHERYFSESIDAFLVVHAPELFYGDHTLDLTTDDLDYRTHSIKELQRTIDVVKALKPYFNNKGGKVGLVTNVGGFSSNTPLSPAEVARRTRILKCSLEELQDAEVEIWPQTMPPFPWHFGGQQFHNLFLSAEWIRDFCEETGVRVCLDVSHSALQCNHTHSSLTTFLETVLPYTAHLHLADASGVDDEGLQIHEGTVDWALVAQKMKLLAPEATWLPEIWQGHENGGHGFWVALERLEKEGF